MLTYPALLPSFHSGFGYYALILHHNGIHVTSPHSYIPCANQIGAIHTFRLSFVHLHKTHSRLLWWVVTMLNNRKEGYNLHLLLDLPFLPSPFFIILTPIGFMDHYSILPKDGISSHSL